MSVSVEGEQYGMEHQADAHHCTPRLSHKPTMDLLTQTTWALFQIQIMTAPEQMYQVPQLTGFNHFLHVIAASQRKRQKSMFLNFLKNCHADVQTNVVKLS